MIHDDRRVQHRDEVVLTNDTPTSQLVILEPSGMELELRSGETFRVVGLGSKPGRLEVDRPLGGTIIYYWETLEVWSNGVLVYDQPIPFPALPQGQSVREFLGVLGLRASPNEETRSPLPSAIARGWTAGRVWDSILWRIAGSAIVGLLAYFLLRLSISHLLSHLAIVGISALLAITGFVIGPKIWHVFRVFR